MRLRLMVSLLLAVLVWLVSITKAAGASREELVEAAFVAAALRAGGAATHRVMALKFFDGE